MSVLLVKPSVILAEAAKVIETRGWTQGVCTSGGKHCAWSAIVVAVTGNPDWFDEGVYRWHRVEEADAVAKVFADTIGLPMDDDDHDHALRVATWNDAPRRTAAEVVSALRAAAAGNVL